MTDLRTAAQQALDALEGKRFTACGWRADCDKAITALRAALAEPTVKESLQVESAVAEIATTQQQLDNKPPSDYRRGYWDGFAIGKREGRIEAEDALAEPVQEAVACEPQYANDDGWCEWVCPQPRGYLMQCCDCGLIHEVDSRVAKYQPRPSEEFEVVDDPDLQVQWRMKRRDDISPKRKPLTEDEIALIVADCSASAHRHDDFSFARAIERAHGIGEQQ